MPALDQVVEQQRDHVVRLDKRPVLIDDAKSISVAVGCYTNVRLRRTHAHAKSLEQMIVRLRSVSAKENVARIVYGRAFDSVHLAASYRLSARSAPHGVKANAQACFFDSREIYDILESS